MPSGWMLRISFIFLSLSIYASPSPTERYTASEHSYGIRALHQTPLTSGPRLFNRSYVQKELIGVLTKYEKASQYLAGIDLNPLKPIPLAENFPTFSDPTAVSPTVSNAGVFAQGQNLSLPNCRELSIDSTSVHPGYGVMPLNDFMSAGLDTLYYGPLDLGSPAQQMTVDIDTGSADLWVPSNCGNCFGNQFDISKSITAMDRQQSFSIQYASGSATGKLIDDIVTLDGLSVTKQVFGAVAVESEDFQSYPSDGLIGMAFSSISTSGAPTFMENLMQQERICAPFFSAHFTRGRESGSELCIGCYNDLRATGPVTWLPVQSKTYWTVQMNGVQITTNTSFETEAVAVIDTGTTLIYVPAPTADQFYQQIPGAKQADEFGSGFFTYPCSANLNVSFILGGHSFPIDQADFNLGMTDAGSGDCVGGVLSLGEGFPSNLTILGDEFLKSWYSIYDYSNGVRVGLAPSINNQ